MDEAGEPRTLEERIRRVVRDALGLEAQRIEPVGGGLGTRRFARVHLPDKPKTLIARVDAPEDPRGRPPGIPPEPPLEPVRFLLEQHGLPVPIRLGADERDGIELLEDLGSTTLAEAAAASDEERRALYTEACALVPRLQGVADPGDVPAFRRRLDDAHFAYKAELFVEWSLRCGGRAATPAEAQVVRDAFARVAGEARRAPARLAHRDLQSANLLVRAGRIRGRRLALIDLQGALLAPPEYDLVCLLRDSYVELPEAEVEEHRERTRTELPDAPDPETFARRFDLLTLTRKGKDHARFLYAAATRGERGFLRFVPATLRALRRAGERAAQRDPALRPLAELLHDLPESPCAR